METVLKSPNVEVEHVQPVRLRNTEGRWRVIVNKVTALYICIYTTVSTHPGCSLHPNCPGGDVSECGLPLSPAGPLLRLHLCPDPHLPQAAGVQPLQVSVDIRIYLFIYTPLQAPGRAHSGHLQTALRLQLPHRTLTSGTGVPVPVLLVPASLLMSS